MAGEDLRRDIIRGSNSRICHQSSGSSPVINNGSVANGKVNLVEGNRVPISPWSRRLALQELLVVVVVVQLVETSRQAKVSELNMATPIEKDVVRLDIAAEKKGKDVRISFARSLNGNRASAGGILPMNEAQLMDRLNGEHNLSNIETRNILGEDFILDQHGHQVSSRQKLHQHV